MEMEVFPFVVLKYLFVRKNNSHWIIARLKSNSGWWCSDGKELVSKGRSHDCVASIESDARRKKSFQFFCLAF